MKYGEELEIRLVDKTGHWYYSEPFRVDKYNTHQRFDSALSVFRENADDALKGILKDVEIDNLVKDFSDATLAAALRNRGFSVTKNTAS